MEFSIVLFHIYCSGFLFKPSSATSPILKVRPIVLKNAARTVRDGREAGPLLPLRGHGAHEEDHSRNRIVSVRCSTKGPFKIRPIFGVMFIVFSVKIQEGIFSEKNSKRTVPERSGPFRKGTKYFPSCLVLITKYIICARNGHLMVDANYRAAHNARGFYKYIACPV